MRRMSPLRLAIIGCVLLSAVVAAADDLRLDRENMRNILNVVAKDIEKNYYDATFGGLDWKTLTEEARKKIDDAKSVSAMGGQRERQCGGNVCATFPARAACHHHRRSPLRQG